MDKLFVRKDIYDELLEKGFGKKDMSKLTKKKITDKNGHTRTVYVKNGEQPATQQQPKAQEELTPEKKARYEEMLEQVKAGPEENALFVRGKGMLNKKDAIAHLSAKLGTKPVNSAAQGHLESDTPQNTDITKEDEERFGKQALSGLSGKRTDSEEKKENYLDAKNEAGKDISENNKIENISETIKFSPEEMKVIKTVAEKINYQPGDEGYLLNTIYSENKDVYSALTKKNKEAWDKSGKKQKTFSSTDLLKERIKSMNGDFGADTEKVSLKDKVKEWEDKGLPKDAAYAKVAFDDLYDGYENKFDEEKEEINETFRDIQKNGIKAKYFKDHAKEYGLETENKARDEFKSKMDKYKKMGLDERASAAMVAMNEIEDQIRDTPDSDVKKLDELRALRTDVQLNGLKSKYIKNILG